MKTKKIFLSFCSVFLISSLLLLSCKKKSDSADAANTNQSSMSKKTEKTETKKDASLEKRNAVPYSKVEITLDEGNNAEFDAMKAFFSPDYSYIVPENPSEAKKSTVVNNAASDQESESAIPEIRRLTDYKTQYAQKREASPKVSYKEDETIESDAPLTVEDWGPQGKVVGEEEHPSFYVIFSQPVKALSALREPSSESDIMEIQPPLKGVFRWYGTRHLSFECEEAADPTTQYKIIINKSLKSLGGKQITGNTEFSTTADPVKIVNLFGAYIKESEQAYEWDTGALPAYANRFYIRLNYQLTEERASEILKVKVGSKDADFTLQANYNKNAFRWYNPIRFDEENKKSNSFVVTIKDEIPFNTKVMASTDGRWEDSYDTLKPLQINYMPDHTDFSQGEKQYPLNFSFNQVIDKDSIYKNIKFNFDFKLNDSNCKVSGKNVCIYNMPVQPGQNYTITLGEGIKDKYGQPLQKQFAGDLSFGVPNSKDLSYVRFLDYGAKMLEAKYPHKLLFEYQNIEPNSYYEVLPTLNPFNLNNPLYNNGYGLAPFSAAERGLSPLDDRERDKRLFEEIDLDPYLKNGFGFVKFSAAINTKQYSYWRGEYETRLQSNTMTIQVTDLGITARIGINKAVFMVRSLSTRKPVEDADVYLFLGNTSVFSNNSEYLAKGKTDSNGFAVIDFTLDQIIRFEALSDSYEYRDKIYALVQKDDDRAVFEPTTHNTWAFDVDSARRYEARKPIQRTFMFVDRGLYKPGEIVTFRGIDRDQVLGSINAHTGNYSITSSGNWWKAKDIIPTITGTLSETGGFYGSFKLPDNLEPGTYSLKYYRDDVASNNQYPKTITFTVANFERLKIEAGITSPDLTFYGGDKISAEIYADYLAGGVLNGADYSVTWFKQETSFNPETPEAKDYVFGSSDYSYGRTYFSQENGTLNSNGKASVFCNTEKITNGNPSIYRIESSITDVSNQRISAQHGITVHPALFYAGLKKPLTMRGFAQKNEKLDFPFILVDTDGKPLENTSDVKGLSYTLSHEEWTVVHEQSVDDTIYTRYEEKTITDSEGKIKAAVNGTVSVTPSKAGWHTLTINGKDKKGNPVCAQYGFYVTGRDTTWYNRYNSEAINLTADQSQYNPGDTAQILLESPLPSGDYLITVEREGIFTQEIRHFDSAANVIEVPISNVYVPVVYVSVASYSERHGEPTHKYGEPDLDKPKGYYGVAPLFVNPYVRAFSVQIESDKNVYRPGEQATLTLTATKGGKPFEGAELTVMAVDRGVIDLINYHVPNPIDFFYNKYNFPLRVKGGDSRSLLMDPVTYSVKNLAGGDADEEKEDERKDFRPTALFEPVIVTDKNGKATCTFTMPDNLTTYRLTAFGVKDDLFALQEDEVKVQNPINIQAVQPRRLRERDTAECGVLITNLDSKPQKVTVSVDTRVPTKNTAQDELEGRITVPGYAFVDGNSEYTVKVAPGNSSVVYFDIAAQNQGTVELVYTIKSDIMNEKLISPIKIEKTYVYETVTMIGATDASKAAKETEAFVIPSFAKEGRGDLSITLDATRLGMLGSSVNYLFEYPYGCLEQQSSRVLPLIIFEDYINVFGLDSKIKDIHKLVTTYTNSWAKSQFENGSFPYWPDSAYISDYVTVRIAHICGIALKHGYTAQELGIDLTKLCNYIAYTFSSYQTSYDYSDYLKAYAAYVLSLFNHEKTHAVLNSLYNKKDDLTLSSLSYIALAYESMVNDESKRRAEEIQKEIRSYLQPVERSVTITKKSRNGFYWWYESEAGQMALILQEIATHNPEDQMVDRLLFTLLQNQKKGHWQNTATTTQVLEAIYTYIKGRNLDATNYTASASIKGKKLMTEKFQGAASKTKTLKLPFEDEFISSLEKDKEIPVEFEKNGDGYLYYTMEMKYALPDEMQTARDEGLKIKYEITDAKTGKLINENPSENYMLKLEDGKLYKATIQLESYRDRTYVALRAPIPSGAEILDSTFVTTGYEGESDTGSSSWRHWISNKYIMDNEIQFFWDNFRSGSTSVTFTFRAARRGIYPLPPVQAECMYEPEIFGRSDGYLSIIE